MECWSRLRRWMDGTGCRRLCDRVESRAADCRRGPVPGRLERRRLRQARVSTESLAPRPWPPRQHDYDLGESRGPGGARPVDRAASSANLKLKLELQLELNFGLSTWFSPET